MHHCVPHEDVDEGDVVRYEGRNALFGKFLLLVVGSEVLGIVSVWCLRLDAVAKAGDLDRARDPKDNLVDDSSDASEWLVFLLANEEDFQDDTEEAEGTDDSDHPRDAKQEAPWVEFPLGPLGDIWSPI